MKIYKYSNYEEYVNIQEKTNKLKINNIWVQEDTIVKIKDLHPEAKIILCHGTRNAAEQKYFRKYYKSSYIFGTEISDTAYNFPMTIRHDFHEDLEIFKSNCDIIYSNSFDHSIDPLRCLSTWSNQLSENGSIFIELMVNPQDNKSTISDPLEISEKEFLELCRSVNLGSETNFYTKTKNGKVFKLNKIR